MSWRITSYVKDAALIGAVWFFLLPQVQAGDRVHAPTATVTYSQPTASPVARAGSSPVTISVVLPAPAQPTREQLTVNLRGPDGQMRRFPVEGGRSAIQTPPVLVLRSGQSVTIRWATAR
jgi:hypothetical protein